MRGYIISLTAPRWRVLFEDRGIQSRDGALRERFAPLQVHVFATP